MSLSTRGFVGKASTFVLTAAMLVMLPVGAIAKSDSVEGQWIGNISGNDPHIGAVFDLKQSGKTVTGTFLWTSDTSGNCKRVLEGEFDPESGVLTLQDTKIVSYHPNPDWRFCMIDKYTLKTDDNGDNMTGEYLSEKCHDKAQIKLHKMKE